jgi:hypothetical protein
MLSISEVLYRRNLINRFDKSDVPFWCYCSMSRVVPSVASAYLTRFALELVDGFVYHDAHSPCSCPVYHILDGMKPEWIDCAQSAILLDCSE